MSAGALASKVLGLAREVLLARSYGTGLVADAYRGSLTLALSPVHLLTTHTLQTCFIPLYTRLRDEAPERAAALFQALLVLFVGASLLLAAALFAGAEHLTSWLLPGFDPQRQALTARMLRVMAAGLPFYIYCVLLGALGAGQRDFTLPMLRPAVQNLGLVVLILVAVATGRPVLAAYGFTLTYIALAAAGSWLYRARGRWPDAWHLRRAGLPALARLFLQPLRPLLLLSVLAQGMILIERYLSSLIGGGTVAAMDYARFVTESAHALLLMPLGLVSLARFAHPPPAGGREETADRVLGLVLLVLVPASVFLLLAGGDLLRVLYQRGAYDAESHRLTHQALVGLGCGLWAIGGAYFLRNVLHARAENGLVLRAEALGAGVNLAFLLLTYRQLGILALGAGLSLGAVVTLAVYLRRLGLARARAPRRFGLLLAGAALHGLLGLGLGRLVDAGGGPAAWLRLGAQVALFLLFWGGWFAGVGELRALAREGWRPAKRRPGKTTEAGAARSKKARPGTTRPETHTPEEGEDA